MDKHARPKLTYGFAQALLDNSYTIRALYIIMQIVETLEERYRTGKNG